MTKKKHNILGEKLKDVLNQYCFQYKTKGGDAIDKVTGKTDENFISDGFADEKTYTKLKEPKVLFIGKEPHHFTERQSPIICEQSDFEKFEDWAYKPFYQNLIFYFYAIDSWYSSPEKYTFELSDCNLKKDDGKTVNKLIERFKKIAFINIKKWDTKDSTSRDTTIKQYAAEYKKPLRKQIKAIDPDIIFLCGTESAFDKLIDNGEWKKEDGDFKNLSCLNCNKTDSQWFYFFTFKEEKKTRLVINYYHPSFTQRPGWIDVLALQNILRNAKTYMLKHNNDEQFKYLLERLAKTK